MVVDAEDADWGRSVHAASLLDGIAPRLQSPTREADSKGSTRPRSHPSNETHSPDLAWGITISRRPKSAASSEKAPGPRNAMAGATSTTNSGVRPGSNAFAAADGSHERETAAVPRAARKAATAVSSPISTRTPQTAAISPTTATDQVDRRSARPAAPWTKSAVATPTRSRKRPTAGNPPGNVEKKSRTTHGRLSDSAPLRIPRSRYSRGPSPKPVPEPLDRTGRSRGPKCDMTRYGELDLCASPRAAPHGQAAAYPFRALAHPREAPMPLAPGTQHLGIDPLAVVPDEHAKLAARALDSHLEVRRTGVAKRVDHRLPPDPIDVVADHRVQGTRIALPDHAELHLAPDTEFVPDARERLLEVVELVLGRAKPPHRVAALFDDLGHQLQHAAQARPAG